MGIANFKYGYVWIDPYKEDDVVGWYDVEKYGEPTYFSNYRRDKEKSKGYCRYIKRAYGFRESDFRWDPDEELQAADTEVHTGYGQAHMEYVELDTGRREYGGYAGSPSGAGKLYRERQTELKDRLRYEHAPDEGYEQRLPGFDTIRGYKTYNDWLSDARSGGGGGPRDSAYQGGDQAEVSAYEQFKRGYNTSDTAAQETESEMDAFTEGSTTRESDIGS